HHGRPRSGLRLRFRLRARGLGRPPGLAGSLDGPSQPLNPTRRGGVARRRPNKDFIAVSVSSPSPTRPIEPGLAAHLRDVAIRAAHSVRADLLAAFRSPMDTDTKVDFHDIVTIHDKRTEKSLKAFI